MATVEVPSSISATPSFSSASVGAIDGREDHGAERTGQERQREDRERVQRSRQSIHVGKHEPGKDDDRRNSVDKKVEGLGCASDDHADRQVGGPHLARVRAMDLPGITLQR